MSDIQKDMKAFFEAIEINAIDAWTLFVPW